MCVYTKCLTPPDFGTTFYGEYSGSGFKRYKRRHAPMKEEPQEKPSDC